MCLQTSKANKARLRISSGAVFGQNGPKAGIGHSLAGEAGHKRSDSLERHGDKAALTTGPSTTVCTVA